MWTSAKYKIQIEFFQPNQNQRHRPTHREVFRLKVSLSVLAFKMGQLGSEILLVVEHGDGHVETTKYALSMSVEVWRIEVVTVDSGKHGSEFWVIMDDAAGKNQIKQINLSVGCLFICQVFTFIHLFTLDSPTTATSHIKHRNPCDNISTWVSYDAFPMGRYGGLMKPIQKYYHMGFIYRTYGIIQTICRTYDLAHMKLLSYGLHMSCMWRCCIETLIYFLWSYHIALSA